MNEIALPAFLLVIFRAGAERLWIIWRDRQPARYTYLRDAATAAEQFWVVTQEITPRQECEIG